MLNLYFSNNVNVEHAYIITIVGNELSENYSQRCQQSCESVQMPYKVWGAYNGTLETGHKPGWISSPAHLEDDSLMSMIKVTDHYLTKAEVACALSHISLWAHCVKIDKPIVILEHDAVMVKGFTTIENYNSIVYLGGVEWAEQQWKIFPIPPHASEGPNYHFICRAHAYAIDPVVAKNMVAHVIKNGISCALDMMLRADLFNISHQGLFAYDKNANKNDTGDTTIKARPKQGRVVKRNDDLSF